MPTPMVGIRSHRPRWQAMPNRLGWARPWPSTRIISGGAESWSRASRMGGSSRKLSNPGTYGNGVGVVATADSTSSREGNERTVAVATERPRDRLYPTSTPAILPGSGKGRSVWMRERSRFWSWTACFGVRSQECNAFMKRPIGRLQSPNSPWQKSSRHSTGSASRRTVLLLGHILPVCSLIAPCPAGAAPVSVLRGTFTTDC